jgi:hypothetical protein
VFGPDLHEFPPASTAYINFPFCATAQSL